LNPPWVALPTKLRAFDLGVDDILTVPFSPEESLHPKADDLTRETQRRDPAM